MGGKKQAQQSKKKVGRPLAIPTPEEFTARANAYFDDPGDAITITGLALAVGLASRKSLHEYRRRPLFSNAVKTAMLRVENAYELRMHGSNPTGAIFVLKNMGWSDRQRLEHSGPDGGAIPLETKVVFVEADGADD